MTQPGPEQQRRHHHEVERAPVPALAGGQVAVAHGQGQRYQEQQAGADRRPDREVVHVVLHG